MSRVTKRKHVMKEMLADNFDHPTDKQEIVRIISSRGNNLHEVESPTDGQDNYLVSMPTKFRNNIWIKRGDFIVVEPIDEGNKVKAEIVRILSPEHIKEFTKDGIWPKKFMTVETKTDNAGQVDDDDDEDEDSDLFRNTNRPNYDENLSDDTESESDEEPTR